MLNLGIPNAYTCTNFDVKSGLKLYARFKIFFPKTKINMLKPRIVMINLG